MLFFRKNIRPLWAIWLCWGIIGLSPIVGHYSTHVISPVLLVFLATLISCLFFIPCLLKNQNWKDLFSPATRWHFLFIGTFGTAIPFSVFLWALHYTTPTNAAILQQSELIYSLLFSIFFLKEIPSKKQLLGSLLILVGVLLVLFKEHYSARWRGDLMILASTWTLQAASCVAKKLPPHLNPLFIAAARSFYALPVLLLFMFLIPSSDQPYFIQTKIETFWILFYTGIFKYGIAMILWYQAIRQLDLSKVTAVYLSYPILTFVLSFLLGIETPHFYQLLGLLLCLAGTYTLHHILHKQETK